MFNSARAVGRYLLLVLAFATLAAPAQAASDPEAGNPAYKVVHWEHEDAVQGVRQAASPVQPADRLWEAHWKHEDRLYQARDLSPGAPRPDAFAVSSDGDGNRSTVLTALAGAAALVLVAAAAAVGIRRSHRRVVPL